MRALTAGEVVNRIKAVMAVQGVPWNDATTRDRFKFGGRVFEESTRTTSRRLAERVVTKRRRELEEGLHGLRKRVVPVLFRVAAKDWLNWKTPALSPRTVQMHETNLSHINSVLGGLLITDIGPEDISNYQKSRVAHGEQGKP